MFDIDAILYTPMGKSTMYSMYKINSFNIKGGIWMSADKLSKVLQEDHIGDCVTVLEQLRSGIRKMHFIDVGSDGTFRCSYTGKEIAFEPTQADT